MRCQPYIYEESIHYDTHLHDLEGLDLAGALDMGTSAQIDQGTTPVDSALLSGDELVNVVQLVLAVREHLLEVLLRNLQSIETLLLLEDAVGVAVQQRPIGFSDDAAISLSV